MKRRALLMSAPAIPLAAGWSPAFAESQFEPGGGGSEGVVIRSYESRARFAATAARREPVAEGSIVLVDGLAYRAEKGAKILPDLPGWLPCLSQDGYASICHFGAVPDGNRLTGEGTDNTRAIRAAFGAPYHLDLGPGTYRVTGPILNLYENRRIRGSGMGALASSPHTRTRFAPATNLLATGTAARRIITRRKYRANASDPNDAPLSTVIENWGGGSIFSDFSIELFCDYTDASPENYGAEWDVGFFNGCRGSVGCERVSINGYFRKAGFYWDVTDAFGIPNHLDLDGEEIPLPSHADPKDEHTIRASGSDHCWMAHCEVRGPRVGRVVLGADKDRTGEPYYDYLTERTYHDFRGGSGCSDFRSRDCIIFGANHHSGYRLADPIGYGRNLSRDGMEAEEDFAPAAQYIDVWAKNGGRAGSHDTARGFLLDDMRYVSWEMFRTRLGQCKEVIFGLRTWQEAGDGLYDVRDTSGTLIKPYDYQRATYGHLSTTAETGWVVWENSVIGIFQDWVHDWRSTRITDRRGREQGPHHRFVKIAPRETVTLQPAEEIGILHVIVRSDDARRTPLPRAAGMITYDTGDSPRLDWMGGDKNSSLQIVDSPSDIAASVGADRLAMQAAKGRLVLFNTLDAGRVTVILKSLSA